MSKMKMVKTRETNERYKYVDHNEYEKDIQSKIEKYNKETGTYKVIITMTKKSLDMGV